MDTLRRRFTAATAQWEDGMNPLPAPATSRGGPPLPVTANPPLAAAPVHRLGKRRPAFKPPAFVKKPALPGAGDGKPAAPPRPTGVPRPAVAPAPARPAVPAAAPKTAVAAVSAAAAAAQAPAAGAAKARYFTGQNLRRLRRPVGAALHCWVLGAARLPHITPLLPLTLAVLYCKFQPTKKLRKNKSFADGVLEVAVASRKAVSATPLAPAGCLAAICRRLLPPCFSAAGCRLLASQCDAAC